MQRLQQNQKGMNHIKLRVMRDVIWLNINKFSFTIPNAFLKIILFYLFTLAWETNFF